MLNSLPSKFSKFLIPLLIDENVNALIHTPPGIAKAMAICQPSIKKKKSIILMPSKEMCI